MTLMSPNNSVKNIMKDLETSIVYQNNPYYEEIIRDIITDNISDNRYSLPEAILDIENYNRQFFRQIAQIAMETGCLDAIYEEFDYIQSLDDAEDCVYEWYFPDNGYGDTLNIVENMVYNAVVKYELPVTLTRDAADEFPVFIRRFSNANGYYIDSLPYEKEINLYANHAQQLMFEELLEDGCASYGRNNVLLFDENKKEQKLYLNDSR